MMHPTVDFKEYLRPGVRVHLSGIGGVSMCPLAEVLLGMGLRVRGPTCPKATPCAICVPWVFPWL